VPFNLGLQHGPGLKAFAYKMELLFPRACQYSNGGRQIGLSGEVMPNFLSKLSKILSYFIYPSGSKG
jgi:hypothetical protein